MYKNLIKNLPNIPTFSFDYEQICPHIFPIRVHQSMRDVVIQAFESDGIEYGFHYKPNHLLPLFKNNIELPNAELLWKEILTLPLHVDLQENDIVRVSGVLNRAICDA